MRGNSLVPFLEGLRAATPSGYSAGQRRRAVKYLAGALLQTVPFTQIMVPGY